ncbi:hypothetical protein jaqu_04350 [Jannaschia aquimarina]|uniref:Uncharacterized protein n=1 Tax=Jannaschia aquimarina TaxID=935700 RepID=A0A0D1EQH3_9RHOB|nr:hypothetical protein jaqu_04350 [Jannaschia aquimarina]SNS90165.1 hypothetical protein SAMN05421775_103240 [Jannaschia aquimarina]
MGEIGTRLACAAVVMRMRARQVFMANQAARTRKVPEAGPFQTFFVAFSSHLPDSSDQ